MSGNLPGDRRIHGDLTTRELEYGRQYGSRTFGGLLFWIRRNQFWILTRPESGLPRPD